MISIAKKSFLYIIIEKNRNILIFSLHTTCCERQEKTNARRFLSIEQNNHPRDSRVDDYCL